MTRIISRAELSRWASVSRASATKACNGPLQEAVHPKGVDAEHPLVREWLEGHGMLRLPDETGTKPAATKTKTRKPPTKKQEVQATGITHIGSRPIEELENMTVKEVVMRFGSGDGFKRYVDSLKNIADYKYREVRVRQQRGELVERDKVAGTVFPLIDVAFSRLVNDVPVALSKQVLAAAEIGGDSVLIEIERLIREANSRVLKNLKQSALATSVLAD